MYNIKCTVYSRFVWLRITFQRATADLATHVAQANENIITDKAAGGENE